MKVALGALFVAACGFHPSGLLSGDGGDAGGSDAGSDAGSSGDQVPTCATPGSIQDDFPGTALGSQWGQFGMNASLAVANNAVTITVNDNGAASGITLLNKHLVDMTGGAIEIDVSSPLPSPGSTSFAVAEDQTHGVYMVVSKGMLTTFVTDGGAPTMNSMSYDGSMPYWRVADEAGQLHTQISGDQSTWTDTIGAVATPSFVATVRVAIGAYAGAGSATIAQVDTNQPAAPWCPASTLHDAFPVGDPQWQNDYPPPPMTMVTGGPPVPAGSPCAIAFAGSLAVTDQGLPEYCYAGTSYAWDLTGGTVKATLVSAPVTTSWSPFIEIADDSEALVELYMANGSICVNDSGGVKYCQSGYDFDVGGQDAYWTISQAAGMISVGNANGPLFSEADPLDPTRVEVRLGSTSTADQSGTPLTATFGAVN